MTIRKESETNSYEVLFLFDWNQDRKKCWFAVLEVFRTDILPTLEESFSISTFTYKAIKSTAFWLKIKTGKLTAFNILDATRY